MLPLANPLNRWFLAGWLHSLHFPVIVLHRKRWCVMHDHSSPPTSLHQPVLRGRGTCPGPKGGSSVLQTTSIPPLFHFFWPTVLTLKTNISCRSGQPCRSIPHAFCFLLSYLSPSYCSTSLHFTFGSDQEKKLRNQPCPGSLTKKQYKSSTVSNFHKSPRPSAFRIQHQEIALTAATKEKPA